MRLLTVVVALLTACAGAACSAKKPPVAVAIPAPPPPPAGPTPAERLDEAYKLLWAGCLDCLVDAQKRFEEIRELPAVSERATIGAIESAALVALRERSLGMTDRGYLARARALAAGSEDLRIKFTIALDAIDATAPRIGRIVSAEADAEILRRARVVQQNGSRWIALLSASADEDPFWAAVWLSFSCANSPTAAGRMPAALLAPLTVQRDTPLVVWEVSTCGNLDAARVSTLVDADPRFKESDYWLGFGVMRADLDEAQLKLMRGYAWHENWPTTAAAIGALYLTSEDFGFALQYFEKALELLPNFADGMVGRVKALSFLGRHDEAIASANTFLKDLPHDARFWRAWNENQLGQLEAAWTDIEEARRLGDNNEVAKLGGLIAYGRREIEVARDRFLRAHRLAPDDCDASYYLGAVQAELKAWTASVDAYVSACSCLEGAITQFRADIVRIEASQASPERKADKVANREAKIALAEREIRQSWFNLGAGYFNLQKFTESRQYAERVQNDEQFGERARSILEQLKNP